MLLARSSALLMLASSKPTSPAVGSLHMATVRSIQPYGAFCSIGAGKDGLIHISQLDAGGGFVDAVGSVVSVGDQLRVRVLSVDDGRTWSVPKPLSVHGEANTTWGSLLASGIALTRGPHAGRLAVALRHDCVGCSDLRTSFVV